MSGALMASAASQSAQATAAAMALSGTLAASSGTGTVTSSLRTVTVPAGNSGVFTFSDYVDSGTITTTQYSRNGGGFTTIADGSDTVAFSNGDTIQVRTNSVGSGEARTFSVTDKTSGATVETATHSFA